MLHDGRQSSARCHTRPYCVAGSLRERRSPRGFDTPPRARVRSPVWQESRIDGSEISCSVAPSARSGALRGWRPKPRTPPSTARRVSGTACVVAAAERRPVHACVRTGAASRAGSARVARITYYVHTEPDSHGRQRFTGEWRGPRGRRGQCFNAVLSTIKRRGDRVVQMPSSEGCLSHAAIRQRLGRRR